MHKLLTLKMCRWSGGEAVQILNFGTTFREVTSHSEYLTCGNISWYLSNKSYVNRIDSLDVSV
jgi:hypothetical protein